jgi:hypothetical protein
MPGCLKRPEAPISVRNNRADPPRPAPLPPQSHAVGMPRVSQGRGSFASLQYLFLLSGTRNDMSRYAVVGASERGEGPSVSIIPSYLERKAIEGTGSAEHDVQAELLLYLVKALEERTAQVDDTLGRELDRIADALELQNRLLAQIAGRL